MPFFTGTAGRREPRQVKSTDLRTYGVRLAGAVVGVDYTAELPIQKGEVDCGATTLCDVDAYAYAIKVGYTIPNNALGLRVGAEYDYASGSDTTSTDPNPDMETFVNLYPTNHDKYGYMDQQGWRNMKAWNINVSAKPIAKLGVRLDYWNFTLADDSDGWYNAAGNATGLRASGCTITATGENCGDKMGSEIDLTANYKYNDAVSIQAGISRFFAGSGLEDRVQEFYALTDDAEDMDWMYVQISANF